MPKKSYPLNNSTRQPSGRSAMSITTIGTAQANVGKNIRKPGPHSSYPTAYPIQSKRPIGS
jgi:hypothetical protein